MKNAYQIIFISLFLLSSSLSGQDLYKVTQSSIKFTSDAPLEMIQAKSNEAEGIIKSLDKSFVFRVPMKTFEGFNSSLQKSHFNTNYLETNKYPYTIFEGKIIEDISLYSPGTYNVRGKGKFICHGIEQERIIKCKLIVKPNKLIVESDFTVFLEDHDIEIPTVVYQKIAEEIMVDIKIELQPK
mgnify:FL=1